MKLKFWRSRKERKDGKREAKQQLESAQEQWSNVHQVSHGLKRLEERNNFAEAIREALRENGT